MISLFSKKEAELYEKKAQRSLLYSIVFFLLFVMAFALIIVLSNYEWQLFWLLFGSFLSTVPFLFSFLFFFQRKKRLDALCIYRQILMTDGEKIIGTYRGISAYPITLPNGFEVYELIVDLEGEVRKFYVPSSKRDALNLEEGSSYCYIVVSNYLKEYIDA